MSLNYVFLTLSPCLERVSFSCKPDFSKSVLTITSLASLTHSAWEIDTWET